NVLNDINNTNLGFLPGEDTNYTLKITNYNLDKRYTELYLIDLVENKTINIHTSGTEYSFVAEQTNSPVNRFKIVTSVSKPDENSIPENQYKPDDSNKTLNIFNADKTLVIDNPTASTGDLTIYDAHYGRVVSKLNFNANQITTVQMNLSDGVYVIKAVTQTEVITKRIIVR
ncbi:MAG: T9SS type A sorting domain-containing protein, partial [Paludibacter sp.]